MQRKQAPTDTPLISSNNDDSNSRLSARSTSTRSLSFHLTRNCLGIGGSKGCASSTFSFAKQRTKIFGSQRRANFSPTIQRNKRSNLRHRLGAIKAISRSG